MLRSFLNFIILQHKNVPFVLNFGLKYSFFCLELCREMLWSLLIFLSVVWLTLNANSPFGLFFHQYWKEKGTCRASLFVFSIQDGKKLSCKTLGF